MRNSLTVFDASEDLLQLWSELMTELFVEFCSAKYNLMVVWKIIIAAKCDTNSTKVVSMEGTGVYFMDEQKR